MVREVEKRGGRGELLPLEEHRRGRGEEQECREGPQPARAGQPVQPRPVERVRDVVVVLEERHEPRRVEVERGPAAAVPLPRVALALVEVAPPHGGDQLLGRAAVVGVVGLVPPGEGDEGGVVEVVVPERVETVAAGLAGADEPCVLRLVLGDDVEAPAGGGRGRADALVDLGENVAVRPVEDLLRRVEPQPVHVELLDPVGRVLDEELARGSGVGAVEVDRLAPLVLVAVGVVVARERSGVVPVGPEVVVDDIQEDADPGRVSPVDEGLEVARLAVEPRRRPQVDAVVPPAETAREVREGQELDDRDPEPGELAELSGCGVEGSLAREGADVHLVDDLAAAPRDAAPARVRPRERGIDDLRRPVRPVGLEARRGVGVQEGVAVQAEAVEASWPQERHRGREVPASLLGEECGGAAGAGRGVLALDHLDRASSARVHAYVRPGFAGLGSDRIPSPQGPPSFRSDGRRLPGGL